MSSRKRAGARAPRGRGWTRFARVGVGVFAAIVLAWNGRTFAAFALLVIGAAALVTPAARFLAPASTGR